MFIFFHAQLCGHQAVLIASSCVDSMVSWPSSPSFDPTGYDSPTSCVDSMVSCPPSPPFDPTRYDSPSPRTPSPLQIRIERKRKRDEEAQRQADRERQHRAQQQADEAQRLKAWVERLAMQKQDRRLWERLRAQDPGYVRMHF